MSSEEVQKGAFVHAQTRMSRRAHLEAIWVAAAAAAAVSQSESLGKESWAKRAMGPAWLHL